MDISKYPLVTMPDGTKHRIIPEGDLATMLGSQGLQELTTRIKLYRAANSLSQGDLAEKLGTTQSKISRIEAGTSEIEDDLKAKLMKELNK